MSLIHLAALIATGIVLIVCGIAVYVKIGGPPILTWTAARIRAKVRDSLGPDGYQIPPELLTQNYANLIGLTGIVVQQADIDLSDNNIAVDVTFAVTELNTTYIIKARGKGDVEFVNDTDGSFYFRPLPGTDGFKLVSVRTADDDSIVSRVGRLVGSLTQSTTLQNLGLADNLIAATETIKRQAEDFVQKYAALAVETALKQIPVYKFKGDWQGWTAKHSFQGYEVKDVVENGVTAKAIVVKVSFWQLTGVVIAYAVGFVALAGLLLFLTLGAH